MPYTRDNMSELARQVIRTSASVTGVQAKMSLNVDRGRKNEPARFTIGGEKSGFGRLTFLDAIMGPGVSKAVSELLIDCMSTTRASAVGIV